MEKNNKDEIELGELFSALKNFLKSIISGIHNFFVFSLVYLKRFVKSHYIILIISSVIGGFISGFISYKSSPTYETNLTLHSPFLTGYNFIYEIEKLNEYFLEKNYEVLGSIIGISEEELKSVKAVFAETYDNYYNIYERFGEIKKKDSLMVAAEMNALLFVVKINLTSKINDVKKIESWLVRYLSENQMLNKRYLAHKTQLLASENKLIRELENLDSLKAGVNRKIISTSPLKQASNTLEISLQDEKDILKNPMEIYEEDLKLFYNLQSVQKEINLLEKVSVINGAKSIKENKSVYLIKNIIYGVFFGFSITSLVLILSIFNRYLVKIEKSSN